MLVSEEYPSKYLKAVDLQGREVRVTNAHVMRETVGNESKLVVYFRGKDKGLVLNKTNAGTLANLFGDDTEHWGGQDIVLFSVMVDFNGKVGPSIRVRQPVARDRIDPIGTGPSPTGPSPHHIGGEEAPF